MNKEQKEETEDFFPLSGRYFTDQTMRVLKPIERHLLLCMSFLSWKTKNCMVDLEPSVLREISGLNLVQLKKGMKSLEALGLIRRPPDGPKLN